jgi:hypothetical protein
MARLLNCVKISLAVLSWSGSLAAAEEATRFEMWEEPSHQLVFVEGLARILDVRIVPGATSDFHKHRFATLYVIIQDALVANQYWEDEWSASAPREYRDPGVTVDNAGYVEKPYYHRVRNEDQRAFHVVAIINERSATDLAAAANDDSTIIDNRWFGEHRVRVAAGADSDVLEFPNDLVLVQYAAGSSHILENGVAHGYKGAPAAFSWHPAESEFRIANRSNTVMEFVLIEVKE